jgi:hypothetical protein
VWHAYRVVPREEELQKVMRYEAHLSRELARLLKDFHAAQKLRRDTPAETPEPCKTASPASPSAVSALPSAPTVYRPDGGPEAMNTPTPSAAGTEPTEEDDNRSNAEVPPPLNARTAYAPDGGPEHLSPPVRGAGTSTPSTLVPYPSYSGGIAPAQTFCQGNRRTGSTAPPPGNGRTNSHRGKHKGRRM